MREAVLALTSEYDMLPRGTLVLCALSGGADSMCLLHLLGELSREEGFTLAAAHYNHLLRGEESERDAGFVAQQCRLLSIPLTVGRGDVAAEARKLGRGIEETARRMRYAFLEETARQLGAGRIATAHNADDNVETLLLHLVRGTGLQGLTGIRPRRGRIVRPLLTTGRAEIASYLSGHGIPHVEDSSNQDEAFARNRLRSQVIPVLQALNPRLAQSMGQTIALLRADNDYLNAQAALACRAARWAEDNLVIEAQAIAGLPNAVACRAVRRLLEQMGEAEGCTAAHLNSVVDLARGENPSAVVFLPEGRIAQRVYRDLLLTTLEPPSLPFRPVPLCLDGETAPEGALWKAICRPAVCPTGETTRPEHFYLSRTLPSGQALLRPRRIGDGLTLPRRSGCKTVKKLMIDTKLPRRDRERIPVLEWGGAVAAVAGFGPEAGLLAAPGEDAWEITFIKSGEDGT